ncbi:ataxia telangiectasia mutated family protein [Clonorchis sinensis]|uniref:non-specific serine/threonine protein kinase n=1 Tax=Clonorchis sinensis TaxID=79923 RepID=G7Y628_CLOSI|nr:ataxia telangiectasia mutated family protein [Clonorchis sinensis]
MLPLMHIFDALVTFLRRSLFTLAIPLIVVIITIDNNISDDRRVKMKPSQYSLVGHRRPQTSTSVQGRFLAYYRIRPKCFQKSRGRYASKCTCCIQSTGGYTIKPPCVLGFVAPTHRQIEHIDAGEIQRTSKSHLLSCFVLSFQQPVVPNKPSLVINLGWTTHLLRWFLARVYVTFSDWSEVATIVDSLLPNMLKFLTELGIVTKLPSGQTELTKRGAPPKQRYSQDVSQVFSLVQDSAETETLESKDSISPSVNITLRQIHFAKPSHCTFNQPSNQSSNIVSRTFTWASQVPFALIHFRPSSFIEPIPELPRSCSGRPMLPPEDIVVFDELFSMWRWLLIFTHHHSNPSAPEKHSLSLLSLSTLLRFLFQEWSHIITRIGFQNEATTWKQLRGLHNYFGVFAATLLLVYDDDARASNDNPHSSLLVLVEDLTSTISSRSDNDGNCKRTRVIEEDVQTDPEQTNLWALLIRLVSSADKGGPFWWLVLDWAVRLRWQYSMAREQSNRSILVTLSDLLERIPSCFGLAKTPLANECLLVALHTVVAILHFEMNRDWHGNWRPTNDLLQAVQQCCSEAFRISLLTTGSRDPNRPGRGDGLASKARLRTQDRLAHDVLLELLHIVTLPKFQAHFAQLRRVISHHVDIHFTKLCNTAPEYFNYPVPWRLRLFVFCGHLLPELQLTETCTTSAALTAFNPALYFFINQLAESTTSTYEESATDHLKRLLTLLFGTHLSSILTFHQRVSCGFLKQSFCELSYGFVSHRTVAISDQQLATAIEYVCQVLAKLPLVCEPYHLDSNPHTLRALVLLAVIWSHLSHVKAHVLHLTHTEFHNLLPSSIVETSFRKLIKLLLTNPTSSKKRPDLTSETFVCEDSNTLLLIRRSFAVLLKHVLIGEFSHSGEMHPYWEKLIHSVVQKPVPICLEFQNTSAETRTPRLSHGSRFGDDEFLDCVPTSANNLETDADESIQEKLIESEKQEQKTNMMLLSAIVCYALRIRSSSLVRLLQCRFAQVFSNSVCDTTESIDWLCTVIDNVTKFSKLSACSLMFPGSDVTFDNEFILLFSCLVDALRESLKARLARISRVKCISQILQLIRCSCQLTECAVRQVRNQHKKTSNESDNLQRWYSIGQHLDQLNRTVWSVVAKHGAHLLCGLGQVAIDCVRSWFKLHSSGIIGRHVDPEYCVSTLLQHSLAPVILQLTEFLESISTTTATTSISIPVKQSKIYALLELISNGIVSRADQKSFTPIYRGSVLSEQSGWSYGFSGDVCASAHYNCSEVVKFFAFGLTKKASVQHWKERNSDSLVLLLSTILGVLNRRPLSVEQCATFSSTGSSSSSSSDMTLHIHQLIHSILISVSGLPVSDYQTSDPCEEPHSSMTLHVTLSCFVQSCIQLTDLCSTSGRDSSTELFQTVRQLFAEPSTVATIVEHILRLLALYQSADNPAPNSTHSYEMLPPHSRVLVLCLCRLATRLKFVKTDPFESKHPPDSIEPFIPALCSLFASSSGLPYSIKSVVRFLPELRPHVYYSLWQQERKWLMTVITTNKVYVRTVPGTETGFPVKETLRAMALKIKNKPVTLQLTALVAVKRKRTSLLFSLTLSLLCSLDSLLRITRSHVYAQRDVQMEATLHHATVAHLVGLAMKIFETRHSCDKNISTEHSRVEDFQAILDKISNILTSLMGPEALPRFQSAICQLPDFPRTDRSLPWTNEVINFFGEHQRLLTNSCSCDRTNPYQAFRLYSSYFEKSKLLCCPALLRYQNWNLNQLRNLIVQLLAPGNDVVPIDQLEFSVGARYTQLQQTAAAICQSSSVSPHELSTVLTTLYERVSYALFSPAFESFREEVTPVIIDRATRAAGLKCLSLLKRLLSLLSQIEVEVECSWATKDGSLPGSNEFSVVNPVNGATWRCFLGTAHLAAFCNSSSASVASQALHRLFSECSSSLDPLLSNSHTSNSVASLSTMLLPYFSVRNTGRNATNFSEAQLTLLQQLSELTRTEIIQFVVDHVKLTVPSSSDEDLASEQNWPVPFILWLLDLPLTLSPIYKALQPLLPVSPSLCKQIFPWLILSVFTSTDGLSASVSEALKLGLADSIAWSLKQSSVCRSVEDLWIDSLLALHTWEQWTRTNGNRPIQSFTIFPAWLVAADRAVVLNRPYAARLFLELAWLNDGSSPEWITSHSTRRRVWLGICRLFADLPGLRTAQIAFLAPCQSTDDCEVQALASDPTAHPMFKETSVAVNELCNNWDRLLGWYDCSLPISSSARLNLAACLHRMAAYNLAQCVFDESIHEPILESAGDIPTIRSSSSKCFSQLQELRAATAWRLGQWNSSGTKAIGPPPTNWSECGVETSFYWIVEAVQRHDWAQVETIASSLWRGLLDDLNKQLPTSFGLFHEISSSCQQINCLERFTEVARSLSVNGLPEALLQCLTGLFDEISHMVDSVASQSSLVDSLIATGSLEPLEPFLTSSLRLVSALLMQLSNRSETSITRSRAFGLLEHTYFEAAESALMTGELRLVDHWLRDATLYRAVATNPDSRQNSDCEQTLLVSQAWRELRSVELVAQLSFYRGEKHISVSHLQTGLETAMHVLSEPLEHCALLVRRGFIGAYMHCVTTLCSWLFASRSKSAGDLLTNYLEPAMAMARRWEATVDPEALANLAQFADSQFTTLDSYLASPEFATRRQLLTEAQRDVECLTDLGEKSRLLRILQRQSALEVEELEAFTSDADRYLEASLDAYAQCLALSDSHDLQIYRLISLWFSAAADPSVQSCPTARARMVNRIMAERLSAIRSDKFLPLIPQLAVRLSCAFLSSTEASVDFQTTLTELVERIVDWHPHHAAFTLLFLVNAELDDMYTADSTTGLQRVTSAAQRSRQTRINDMSNRIVSENHKSQQTTEQNSRIQAARRLYARLLEGRRGPLLQQMQSLAEAYVEWANFNVDKHRGSTADIPFPSGCMLHRFAISPRQRVNVRQGTDALSLVAIPTDVLRIDRSGQYDRSNVVCISGFAPTFRLAGGINMPKIVTCWGTDGRSRRQLVKGRDDPRQDAVMQQVFVAANRLFYQRRRQSRAHLRATTNAAIPCDFSRCRWLDADGGLRVRTYKVELRNLYFKVIPMAQRSGVIEWCEGTVPLGEWLAADRTGAHQRYRPKDLPPGQAKQRLAAVRDRPYERRLMVFDEICQKLNPVLAYFYLEHFPDPQQWCRARYAYTRSLAASSLVGYLVGLGDRHPHNLLLHRASGELVHIDLGVAFDQVLLYDPLYSWSMTPAQLCALEARRAENTSAVYQAKPGTSVLSDQTNIPGKTGKAKSSDAANRSLMNSTSECGTGRLQPTREPLNQLAERVLLNVRSKLEGRVTGNMASASSDQRKCGGLDQLDVSGHVGMLVRAATDRTQLARMYFGWQAYL